MKVTVIGYMGAYPDKDGATSGYLVEEGDTKVLLDCGSGVLSKVQNYVELWEIDAVVLSHCHADHSADIGCMQYAAMIETLKGNRKKPLEIWGNGDTDDISKLNYEAYCIGKSYEQLEKFKIGDLFFRTNLNVHEVKAYSISVESMSGKKLVYSGDTGYYEGLSKFANKADCFICEASFYKEQQGKTSGHLSDVEAGKIAQAAQVKTLILTHFPHYGEHENLIANCKEEYDGEIMLASRGLNILL